MIILLMNFQKVIHCSHGKKIGLTGLDETEELKHLSSLINENGHSEDYGMVLKMDIEGWERAVVKGNADFFTSAKVKLSCCVYHRQDDARVLDEMLKGMGYKTRFSDGYMLPTMNGIHYPYFAKFHIWRSSM